MAPEPAGQGGGAFGVKRVVFAVGAMSFAAQRVLRKRLGSELDAVRGLIRKAELFPGAAGPLTEAGGAGTGEDGLVTAAAELQTAAPMQVDGASDAKRRKASSLAVVRRATEEPMRTTAAGEERERLAGRLASLAAALPDHAVAFLQNQSDGHGNSVTETRSTMKDDSALVQLKLLLDRFAPENTTKEQERAALDASGVTSGTSTGPVEKDGDVGASRRVELRDIAEEYSELVGAIGVLVLSPLPRKLVDVAAEHDEYVDILGDASPVVFPAATAAEPVGTCSSPSSSSGGGSSDSDTSDSSGSDSDSDSGGNVGDPPALPNFRSEQAAQPPTPTPKKVRVSENEEEMQQHCAAPTAAVRPIASSPPVLPKESDIAARLQKSAPDDAMQIANPKELQNLPALTEPPISNISPPAPAFLPVPNQTASAQPPAPDAVIVEPEEEPHQDPAAEDGPLTDLISKAQEAMERRRQEERSRAREEARRELLEVERAALPDERVRPADMERLGIAAFEHIVSSTVEGVARGRENNGLRVARAGCPTVMQFLGLFLKPDGDGGSEELEQQRSGGTSDTMMDIEEGEIR
jgi:hypothetical protein